jgi:hypothetical protein
MLVDSCILAAEEVTKASSILRDWQRIRAIHSRCSVIIRYFALKSARLWLGASRLHKTALLSAVLMVAGISACGGGSKTTSPPSGIATRVFASQSVSSPTAAPGLIIIDGELDTLARRPVISAGTSPGLMAISPNRTTVLVFDSILNDVNVVSSVKETMTGTIPMPCPIPNVPCVTSMVALDTGFGYVPVPSAPSSSIGTPPGALEVLNLVQGGIAFTLSVPNAQTAVASPDGSQLLVFNGSNTITVISPNLVDTGFSTTTTVGGFDSPVYAVFSADSSTAYVMNCGPECGGTQASVQPLNMSSLTLGTPIPVDGATDGLLSGSTLYVAGNSLTNNACTGETTAATTCGRLDIIDLSSMAVTGSAVITDGYHDRIDLSNNGQLFIGSYNCTEIGNVNNITGEVRGCLSIFNSTNGTVVIPPDNGDVTALQSFTTRDAEYVAEGGNLRVYDTSTDSLLITEYIETGTITIRGQIVDIKAVDFF